MVFLCPHCTCWFTHKSDLQRHVKFFCDRKPVEVAFC